MTFALYVVIYLQLQSKRSSGSNTNVGKLNFNFPNMLTQGTQTIRKLNINWILS